MLFTPAQLQRQVPHRGTGARPRQSLYQPTDWLRPRRGITMVLARATGARGGVGAAGATAGTALATGAATTGIAVAAAAAQKGGAPAVPKTGHASGNAGAAARFAPFTRSSRPGDLRHQVISFTNS